MFIVEIYNSVENSEHLKCTAVAKWINVLLCASMMTVMKEVNKMLISKIYNDL